MHDASFESLPLYIVAVGVSVCIAAASTGSVPSRTTIIAHVLMLHGFSAATITGLNSPLWTMPIDIAFYIALPLVALLLKGLPAFRSRIARTALMSASLAAVFSASLTYRDAAFRHHPLAASDFTLATVYIRNIVGMSASFCLGVTLALLIELKIRLNARTTLAVAACGGATAALQFFGRVEESGTPLALTVLDRLAAISSACVLAPALLRDGTPMLGSTAQRLISAGAAISYGVYLFHCRFSKRCSSTCCARARGSRHSWNSPSCWPSV